MFLITTVFAAFHRETCSRVTEKKNRYKDIVSMTFFFSSGEVFIHREKSVFVLFVGKANVQNQRKVSFPDYS